MGDRRVEFVQIRVPYRENGVLKSRIVTCFKKTYEDDVLIKFEEVGIPDFAKKAFEESQKTNSDPRCTFFTCDEEEK